MVAFPETRSTGKNIVITAETFPQLKQAYQAAADTNADSFTFEGSLFVTGYAKYLIEHLENEARRHTGDH